MDAETRRRLEALRERLWKRAEENQRDGDLIDDVLAALPAEPSPDVTHGCDCDQSGNPDRAYHASDCAWRLAYPLPKGTDDGR